MKIAAKRRRPRKNSLKKKNKAREKAKGKSQAMDIRRLAMSNSRGVGAFKEIFVRDLESLQLNTFCLIESRAAQDIIIV